MRVLQKANLIAVPTVALCEMVWVLLRGYRYTSAQVAHAVNTLLQVRQVVCHAPSVLAGLALLENGGDFANGVIAFEGSLLGGTEFVSFDQQAIKPSSHQAAESAKTQGAIAGVVKQKVLLEINSVPAFESIRKCKKAP